MNLKVKGTILGIVSAVSYGTNPLGGIILISRRIEFEFGFVLSFFIGGSCFGMYSVYSETVI